MKTIFNKANLGYFSFRALFYNEEAPFFVFGQLYRFERNDL
jgi:hypothetical protein